MSTAETPSKGSKISENEDKLTKTIGEFGRWHIYLFVVLGIPTKMSLPWTQMAITFLAPKTTFRCKQLTNATQEIQNSTCYSDCEQYEYFTEFENTIISEWDLICDRAWLAHFTQTVCMFGVFVGSIGFGFISDRWGRRPALLTACMLQLVTSLVTPFAPSYWSFTAIRFFLGTATAGTMITTFVILAELSGPNKRDLMNCIFHLPLAFGEIIMPVIAYYLRSWDKFSLGVGVPYVVFLSYFFIVPESPKWLITMGRVEEASKIMEQAAKWNKLPYENMLDIAKSIEKESKMNISMDEKKATYLDLITIPGLRINNLCSCISWFVLGLGFYGGSQYVGQTASNVFLTVLVAGVIKLPATVLSSFFSKRWGRRVTVLCCLLICSCCSILLLVPEDWVYMRMIAGTISLSGNAGAFTVMYIFSVELFPTVARNMAMGASSTAARVGSMVGPLIVGLAAQAYWIPPVVFAGIPLIAAAACLCLKETRGKKMADHLGEE